MAVGLGCKSGDRDRTAAGGEGDACYEDGTCNPGLDCRSGLCVNLSVAADVLQGLDPGSSKDSIDSGDVAESADPGSHTDSGNNTGTQDFSVMVPISPGTFIQGCILGAPWPGCSEETTPFRIVDVPAFEIDKFEVTVGLYGACVDEGVCLPPNQALKYSNCNTLAVEMKDYAVGCISWDQARIYCDWAGKRLCTESEWEKAARGAGRILYPWGAGAPTCEYAVICEKCEESGDESGEEGCGTGGIWPVGSKPLGASPYGVHDMVGNVSEWVEDDYHGSYDGAPMDGRAWIDEPRGSDRVRKGANVHTAPVGLDLGDCFVFARGGDDPEDYWETSLGVRCCRSGVRGRCSAPDVPEGSPCDDGNPCTTGETCSGGYCDNGAPVVCEGDNICGKAVCDTFYGCRVQPIEEMDRKPCPGGKCYEGVCCQTSCAGRECGDDGCGGNCGHCNFGYGEVCTETGTCEREPCGTVCGGVGAPCNENSECRIGMCLTTTWYSMLLGGSGVVPDGMCTVVFCSGDAECEEGASCLSLTTPDMSLCAPTCTKDDDCREGFSCSVEGIQNTDGIETQGCLPDAVITTHFCGNQECDSWEQQHPEACPQDCPMPR